MSIRHPRSQSLNSIAPINQIEQNRMIINIQNPPKLENNTYNNTKTTENMVPTIQKKDIRITKLYLICPI